MWIYRRKNRIYSKASFSITALKVLKGTIPERITSRIFHPGLVLPPSKNNPSWNDLYMRFFRTKLRYERCDFTNRYLGRTNDLLDDSILARALWRAHKGLLRCIFCQSWQRRIEMGWKKRSKFYWYVCLKNLGGCPWSWNETIRVRLKARPW